MPCYQVQTAAVELNNADADILEKSLKKLGYTVSRTGKNFTFRRGSTSGSYSNNRLNVQSTDGKPDTDQMKRAYSEGVIQTMADRYAEDGWELTQDGDEYILQRPTGYGNVYA